MINECGAVGDIEVVGETKVLGENFIHHRSHMT
jgi:hypothetical protein